MKGLDLRKFKKVSSDKHTTTLEHPDGHKISIAHSKLKGDLKAQLEKLPAYSEGGSITEAEPTVRPDKGWGKVTVYPQAPEIHNYANGTPDGPIALNSVETPQDPSLDLSGIGSAPSQVAGSNLSSPKDIQGNEINAAGETSGTSALKNTFNAEAEKMQDSATPAAVVEPELQNVKLGLGELPGIAPTSNPYMDALAMQEAGLKSEAGISGSLGKQQADILLQHQIKEQEMQQQFQQESKHVLDDYSNLVKDVKAGHIDPNRYWNSQTSLGKISSAIGLLLGGMGAGLTGKDNPAMTYLNNQIERDVDSQKTNMVNKQNLMHALHTQYGDMKDASNMMRVFYADMTAQKMQQAAMLTTDPMAKARLQQAMGQLKAQYTPLILQTTRHQALMKMVQNGSMGGEMLVPDQVPKEHQEAVYKELERAQNTQKNSKAILDAFDTAANQIKAMPGNRSGVKAFHAALGPTFADIEGTVRQAAMDNAFENMTPQFGDSDTTKQSKRQSVLNYIAAKSAAPRANSFGIPVPKSNNFKQRQKCPYYTIVALVWLKIWTTALRKLHQLQILMKYR